MRGIAALAAAHKRRVELEVEFGRQTGLQTLIAADFLHSGCPAHARLFDRKGTLVEALDRHDSEDLADFRQRAYGRAQEAAGASRIVLGALDRPTAQAALAGSPVTL